ncbi:MAG: electron transfer flavoprotein subunit alpha/FixB family protein [Desulfobacteraceae bacterium]|nr:electron transfer flavoprotein subunit alpha/FixB family protein [Desulfobacteraceae bacterium]
MKREIWLWVHHRRGTIEDETFGLAAEACRLAGEVQGQTSVSAVCIDPDENMEAELKRLGSYGVEKVFVVTSGSSSQSRGELYASILTNMIRESPPVFFLMAHDDQTAEIGSRVAAGLQAGLVTRAVDLRLDEDLKAEAVRPVDNGYVFERVEYNCGLPYIATILPSVLSPLPAGWNEDAEIIPLSVHLGAQEPKTEVLRVIEADPESLDIEEADIIVSAGRGMGKEDEFGSIYELAEYLGGSVAGTRPVIDRGLLPFDRQIGQTGKTVSPRLCVNCGISGANEYTAGIEKSNKIVAINKDPGARIFRFADLGLVGDVHQILPLLFSRINEKKGNGSGDE